MDIIEFFNQFLQYFLGVIPGDIASDIIALLTTIVTISTLIVKYWKTEPSKDKKFLHFLWRVIKSCSSLKLVKKGKTDDTKEDTSTKPE